VYCSEYDVPVVSLAPHKFVRLACCHYQLNSLELDGRQWHNVHCTLRDIGLPSSKVERTLPDTPR
jgi:hypothetical protein